MADAPPYTTCLYVKVLAVMHVILGLKSVDKGHAPACTLVAWYFKGRRLASS